MRWSLPLAILLCAAGVRAELILCPDGTRYEVDDPLDAPCVYACAGGGWAIEDDTVGCPKGRAGPETRWLSDPNGPSLSPLSAAGELARTLVRMVVGFGVLAFAAGLYFLPAIVAWQRRHHQTLAIFILNLLLGWTVLAWIGALIWAATAVRPELRETPE